MPEEIKLQVPVKLAQFIDKLTSDGYFNSREDFARCSLEILAQLYGHSKTSDGKALLDVIADYKSGSPQTKQKTTTPSKPALKQEPPKTTPKPAPKQQSSEALAPEDYDVLDLFSGMTFEFEDALHARYTMELMKQAKAPLPKDEFLKILVRLQNNGNIEKSEHNGKVVWKLLEGY